MAVEVVDQVSAQLLHLRLGPLDHLPHQAMSRMIQLMHHGESWEASGSDLQLFLDNVNDLMMVVALLFIELTAEENENTSAEDRRRLLKTNH